MSVFSDVTEKALLEQNLHFQDERFRMLLDFLRDDVIYTLDKDGYVDTWNKSGQRCTGIMNANAIGTHFQEMLNVFGCETVDSAEFLQKVCLDGRREIECRTTTLNGEEAWFQTAVTKLTDRHGELLGYSVIAHNVTDYKNLEHRLKYLSETDPLTGVANRRAFEALMHRALKHAERTEEGVAIAILDIDHFKQVNDTYGHAAGDDALIAFVRTVMQSLRKSDALGRLGGEEFGVVLYGADDQDLLRLLERVRSQVEQLVVRFEGQELRFTVSLGVCFWRPGHTQSAEAVLRAADKALYRAKTSGRNRIELEALR